MQISNSEFPYDSLVRLGILMNIQKLFVRTIETLQNNQIDIVHGFLNRFGHNFDVGDGYRFDVSCARGNFRLKLSHMHDPILSLHAGSGDFPSVSEVCVYHEDDDPFTVEFNTWPVYNHDKITFYRETTKASLSDCSITVQGISTEEEYFQYSTLHDFGCDFDYIQMCKMYQKQLSDMLEVECSASQSFNGIDHPTNIKFIAFNTIGSFLGTSVDHQMKSFAVFMREATKFLENIGEFMLEKNGKNIQDK